MNQLDDTTNGLRLKSFLEMTYEELETLNTQARSKAESTDPKELETEYRKYLVGERRIKAVTLCFSDIEGRLHMLDYDKHYFLKSVDNLTFDGSSIRGFTEQNESDLRLEPDWSSIRYLPSDIFGPGKVIFFANVLTRERAPYAVDLRGQLSIYAQRIKQESGLTAYASAEIEGFLVDGINAEQTFAETGDFKLISTGGYFHSLPLDRLRVFIDRAAEAQRALGFINEKDHPEVAPSQFEMNFSYADVVRAADQVQLYKLVCRQVARTLGMTATFLPKPMMGINGSGMHTNFSLAKANKNIFYDTAGQDGLSAEAWDIISRLLNHAPEICLVFNSSVNAYRRLDPHFEAPNQIKVSPIDRGSMIRIPVGNERTARIEVRSIAPDSNPYLVLYAILRVGLEGTKLAKEVDKRERLRFLPDNIHDALRLFRSSDIMSDILGKDVKDKLITYKQKAADRSPKELGTMVKQSEIIYHHEVTNQYLWSRF